MQKMLRGGESAFEELFAYACPKFITPAPPSLDAPSMNTNQVQLLFRSPPGSQLSQHYSAESDRRVPEEKLPLQVGIDSSCQPHQRLFCPVWAESQLIYC